MTTHAPVTAQEIFTQPYTELVETTELPSSTQPPNTTAANSLNTGDPPDDFAGDPPSQREDPTGPSSLPTLPKDVEGCENAELMDATIDVPAGVTEITLIVTDKHGTTTEYPNVSFFIRIKVIMINPIGRIEL